MKMYYLESTSTDPYYNLALEEYVFNSLPRSNEYFMLWQNANAIIVGKYQNTIEEINIPYVQERKIKVARRLSGGGAVYHDLGNLNFTFVVDAAKDTQLDMAAFCVPVVKALSHLGIDAQINGRNDITINGKKFSGNSQYLRENRVMHHGTLMFDSNLDVVAKALTVSADKIESKGIKSVRSRVTNIKEYLDRDMTMQEFKGVLKQYIAEQNCMQSYVLTEKDQVAIKKIQTEHYSTWDWNYGMSPVYSIRKERRVEGCGKIQIFLGVEKGIITAFSVRGDYFGSGDPADVEKILVGRKANSDALKDALSGTDINFYFNNLKLDELIQIILQ